MANAAASLPEWSQPGFVPFSEVAGVTEPTLQVCALFITHRLNEVGICC